MTQTRGRSKGGSRGKKAGSRGKKGGLFGIEFGCNPPNFPPYANVVWGSAGDECLQQKMQDPTYDCGDDEQQFFFHGTQQISDCSLKADGKNMTAQDYYDKLSKKEKCFIWKRYNMMNKQSCGRIPGCKRFTPFQKGEDERAGQEVAGRCTLTGGCGHPALDPAPLTGGCGHPALDPAPLTGGGCGCGLPPLDHASLTSGGRRRKHKKSKKTKRSHKRKTKKSKRSHKRKTRKTKKTRRHRRRR